MNKISYLKGLLDGLEVNPESREGKMFYAVCAALEETADYVEKLEDRVAQLEELCSILDEDLGAVEEKMENAVCGCTSCDSQVLAYSTEAEQESDKPAENQMAKRTTTTAEAAAEAITAIRDEIESAIEDAEHAASDESAKDFLEDGEEEYETVCPTCGKSILLTEKMLEDGETTCPNCGEELEFDFDEEEIEKLAPADEK